MVFHVDTPGPPSYQYKMPKRVRVKSHQEAIKRFLSSPKDTVALVPNTRWVDEINRRILSGNKTCSLGQRVFTLQDFVREHSAPVSPVISIPLQNRLIEKIITSSNLSYFKTPSAGVVASVRPAISAMKRNLLTPDELAKVVSTRGGLKENDLLTIYKAFEGELTQKAWHTEPFQPFQQFQPFQPCFLGFDMLMPWMEAFGGGIFFEAKPEERLIPKIYQLNSPSAESRFISQAIAEYHKKGVQTEEIGIFLKAGSRFIWDICTEEFPRLRDLSASQIISSIFSDLSLQEKAPVEKFVSAIRDKDYIGNLSLKTNPPLHSRTLSHVDNLNNILDQINFEENLLGHNTPVTRTDFLRILKDHLETTSSWPKDLPFQPVAFEDAGLYNLKVAIIPRLNDEMMPSNPSHISFFSDPELINPEPDSRIDLIFPSHETQIRLELNRFRLMFADETRLMFADETIISYPAYSASGRETQPSPFIIKYPVKIVMDQNPDAPEKTNGCGTNFSNKKVLSKLKEQLTGRIFSATQLEEYAECPFAYFCHRIMGIDPPEDITPEIQPHDRGTLVHETLEVFFKKHRNIYKSLILGDGGSSQITSLVAPLVDEVFDKNREIMDKYHPDMVNYFKRHCGSYVVTILEDELQVIRSIATKPIPSRFEFEFQDKLDDETIVRGKIDRIDEDKETFTVIDYKTGSVGSIKSNIKAGKKLQLPIYTEMARRALKKEPAAGFLYDVKESKRKGIARREMKDSIPPKTNHNYLATEEEWNELIEIGLNMARTYAANIREGKFFAEDHKCNSWCDWKDVCRNFKKE